MRYTFYITFTARLHLGFARVAAAGAGFAKNEFILIQGAVHSRAEARVPPAPYRLTPLRHIEAFVLQFQLISMLINNDNGDAMRRGADATETRIIKATEIPRYFSRVWHVSLDFPVLDSHSAFVPLPSNPLRRSTARARPPCDKLGFKAGVHSRIHPTPLINCQSCANGQLNFRFPLSLSPTSLTSHSHSHSCSVSRLYCLHMATCNCLLHCQINLSSGCESLVLFTNSANYIKFTDTPISFVKVARYTVFIV